MVHVDVLMKNAVSINCHDFAEVTNSFNQWTWQIYYTNKIFLLIIYNWTSLYHIARYEPIGVYQRHAYVKYNQILS